jgi:hypothetical protein
VIKNALIAVLAVLTAFVTYGLVAGYRELARRRGAVLKGAVGRQAGDVALTAKAGGNAAALGRFGPVGDPAQEAEGALAEAVGAEQRDAQDGEAGSDLQSCNDAA